MEKQLPPAPQYYDQRYKRQSFESMSEVSETAVSSFNDVQPTDQELYLNYPQQYAQQYSQQYYQPQQYQPTAYNRNVQEQYQYAQKQEYQYAPSQTAPYAYSNTSYQNEKPITAMQATKPLEKESSNLNRFSSVSGKSISSQRYCCGMFKSKKKCTLVCIPLCIFILAAIGVTMFFVWPRVPGFKVGTPQNVNTKALGTIEDLRNASKERPFRASFDLRVDITVASENYIPWNIGELKIDGKLINPITRRPNKDIIGNGTRRNVLILPRNTTTFGFIFTVLYDIVEPMTRANRLEDERLLSLAMACKPDVFGQQPIPNYPTGRMGLEVSTSVGFLGINFGLSPTKSEFDCPQSVFDLLDLIVKATEVLQ